MGQKTASDVTIRRYYLYSIKNNATDIEKEQRVVYYQEVFSIMKPRLIALDSSIKTDMKPSFCAIANQQVGEDLIGTAGHYQTYVLIECPRPWAAKVFKSEGIPAVLRNYIKALKAERSVQFLAINRDTCKKEETTSSSAVTLMVYERTVPSTALSTAGMCDDEAAESVQSYRGYEFQLDDLTQVIGCLEAHWQGDRMGKPITTKDILICTHGMRDKCCARFGQPFFRDASHSAKSGELPDTRLWRVSHIGGHRFAPTAISLPDGRYYGRLTLSALQAIVTHSGSVQQLMNVYRGWGLLPAPLQLLERQLMLQHGWSWFDHTVTYRVLADSQQSSNGQSSNGRASTKQPRELSVEVTVLPAPSNHTLKENIVYEQATVYRAKVVQDPQKTVCTKLSCSSAVAVPVVKYTVAECVEVESKIEIITSTSV